MNYNHLYYFWIIAKEGGVTAACKRLRLAQPTLSGQLKQFEEYIGSPLFDRKSRKLILNDVGKVVFDYADRIFKMGEEMLEVLRDRSVKGKIDLNVGMVSTMPQKNVHNFLKVPLSHRTVNLTLVSGSLDELLEKLSNHYIDMILSDRKPTAEVKGYYTHLLEKVPVVFAASPDFKKLRRKFPESLQGQKLFLPSLQSNIRSQVDAFLKKHNVTPDFKGEVQDDEMLRVMAVSGDGIVAIVRSAISDLIKTKELYIIGDLMGVFKHFYLITAERKVTHPIVLEILKKYGD